MAIADARPEHVPMVEGKLGILGVGRLGEALLSGLLRSGAVTPAQIRGSVRHAAPRLEHRAGHPRERA